MLQTPGTREGDGTIANHADVLVTGGRAYIYYFTHPAFSMEHRRAKGYVMTAGDSRTVVQAAELYVDGGRLRCDRDAPCFFSPEVQA